MLNLNDKRYIKYASIIEKIEENHPFYGKISMELTWHEGILKKWCRISEQEVILYERGNDVRKQD